MGTKQQPTTKSTKHARDRRTRMEIHLSVRLKRRVKARARRSGTSASSVVTEALGHWFRRD